ncbi:hypothetical protein [Flavobacterium sp.]|uniref:hypothetical protein n=1 Tax=Flavobacterium sp. TaxID=239 RepID=UPI003D6ABAF0
MLIDKIEDSKRIFEYAIKKSKPDVIIALVSGGDDSIAAMTVAKLVGNIDYVVHVDTTVGIQAVTDFVKDYVKDPLIIARTNEETYEELVLEHGFPGPGQHQTMYIKLKERALRLVQRRFQLEGSFCRIDGKTAHKREIPLIYHPNHTDIECLVVKKPERRIMYISGGRKDESIRRMGTVKEFHKEGNQYWCSIIANWSKQDIYELQKSENLQRSPTSKILGRSGECNCGSYGFIEEVQEMEHFFPNDPNVKMIIRLQKELQSKGHKYCNYGHGRQNKQIVSDPKEKIVQHLCSTCINNPRSACK